MNQNLERLRSILALPGMQEDCYPEDKEAIEWAIGLFEAINEHHSQKADDRCIEDDDKLYAAAGLPRCDRRVGNRDEMLANCRRFIDRRCEGGGWATYRELETVLQKLVHHYPDLAELLGEQGDAAAEIINEAKRLLAKGTNGN